MRLSRRSVSARSLIALIIGVLLLIAMSLPALATDIDSGASDCGTCSEGSVAPHPCDCPCDCPFESAVARHGFKKFFADSSVLVTQAAQEDFAFAVDGPAEVAQAAPAAAPAAGPAEVAQAAPAAAPTGPAAPAAPAAVPTGPAAPAAPAAVPTGPAAPMALAAPGAPMALAAPGAPTEVAQVMPATGQPQEAALSAAASAHEGFLLWSLVGLGAMLVVAGGGLTLRHPAAAEYLYLWTASADSTYNTRLWSKTGGPVYYHPVRLFRR